MPPGTERDSVRAVRAIVIEEFGPSHVLRLREDWPEPQATDDTVLVDVTSAGINFADTHARENTYLARYELPLIPGAEIAGVVAEATGSLEEGQRVVSLLANQGGYAERVAAPAATTWPIPDGVSDGQALAIVLQGLTAWHLYKTAGRVAPGESVVVHAAAGGVGSIAVQLGKPMGAGRVIASASSEEKRALALELGADAAVDPDAEDLNAALREANGGAKVDVVFEMAGGRVFDESLRALAPLGRLVAYGIAGGEPNTVVSGALMRRSQAVVGFWLMHCFARPEEWIADPLRELFALVADGSLRPIVGETYPMSEASRAHDDIESRKTSGKLLLDPSR
jgi:NADPH2:quinone reductase